MTDHNFKALLAAILQAGSYNPHTGQCLLARDAVQQAEEILAEIKLRTRPA